MDEGGASDRLELVVQGDLQEIAVVDGAPVNAGGHVEVVGAGPEGRLHQRVVPLGDDCVDQQVGACGETGDVLHIPRVHLDGRRLAGPPGSLDLLGTRQVPVADDDLVYRRMLGEVPREDMALLAGAYDHDFHGLPPESNQPVR